MNNLPSLRGRKSGTFLLSMLGIFLLLATACNKPNIKLVNQIKTFQPRWAVLGEDLGWVDRNLKLMENRFEKDYKFVEPLFDQVPDSLNGPHFRSLKKQYPELIETRDDIRKEYREIKTEYVELVNEFNQFEHDVLEGDVKGEVASKRLETYKKRHREMMDFAAESKTEMEKLVADHNSILRELAVMVNTPTNLDMKLK